MAKSHDEIVIMKPEEEILLAKREGDIWTCEVCPTEFNNDIAMMHHVRMHVDFK